ncbi:MAG: hypothetical protein GY940_26810 [bacterium]|nr:hypothetical protein [bacterium]
MNHLMNNMKNIPGVVGVAIFKDDGNLAAFDFPGAYDKSLLDLMGLKFQPIKEILPQEEGEIVYLCWEFEELLGFYYPVEGGWVNILSSDHIPMPVFSLTMTAVSNKLPALLKDAQTIQPQGQGQPPVQAPAEPAAAEVTGNTVPMEKIEDMEAFFSNYLGPASKVIFKRVALHLGFQLKAVPENSLKDLLDGVIAKVPENKRNEAGQKAEQFH